MRKVVVLSADAMVSEDLATLKTLPNYRKYLQGGCEITQMQSVYPTITYPAHTTIATGVYPDRHGIDGNLVFEPTREGPLPWKWFHSAVQAPDIFTAAKKVGMKTAAVFWPVTGNHPDIDYLIDEYWTQYPGQSLEEAFAESGSNAQMLEIVAKNRALLEGKERTHPGCDEFVIACACDILAGFSPDLLMIHPANIDGYRHQYGLFNEHVTQGIIETDRWIGQLFAAMERAGTLDETDFFLISDHGQLEIKRIININALLTEAGLITLDDSGKIVDWKAYCLSGGMSALVHLKDPADRKVYEQTYALLTKLKDEEVYGISEVFTEAYAREHFHLGGPFSFVLETDGYTSFGDSPVRPLVRGGDTADYRYGRATHGYLPQKGPQPVLVARGPHIRPDTVLPQGHLVDAAPTFARVLGIELGDVDGKPIEEILL